MEIYPLTKEEVMTVKHAIKSTEFYLAALAVALLGINLMWAVPEFERIANTMWSVIGIVLIVAIYIIGRTSIKKLDVSKV